MEAVLRLRRLGGDQFDITLVSPSDTLVYRPLSVLEPFGPRSFSAIRWLASCLTPGAAGFGRASIGSTGLRGSRTPATK